MISFKKHILSNGLRVIVNHNPDSPVIAMNVLYNVGSKDESVNRTGFAHLFEHLMFGGSVNIPDYDTPLQLAGGENNAFTNTDITNYYLTVPRPNVETAFWLESDRMLNLAFTPKSLETQRNVVVEEFKQSYLNQPYGDKWLLYRPLAYQKHPYRWATIGITPDHIAEATMDDVKVFYNKWYNPDNAILSLSGDIDPDTAFNMAEKWFGSIPYSNTPVRNLAAEPAQTAARKQEVYRDVPLHELVMGFHMCKRNHPDFYPTDMLSDILSSGDSSRLYRNLVKEQRFFVELNAYVTGELESGLFIISGRLAPGISPQQGEEAIWKELNTLISTPVNERELEKIKNRTESYLIFSALSGRAKAYNLAYGELMGDAQMVNEELTKYQRTSARQMQDMAQRIFQPSQCNTLYYLSNQTK